MSKNKYTDKFVYEGETYTARYETETETYRNWKTGQHEERQEQRFKVYDKNDEQVMDKDPWRLKQRLQKADVGDKVVVIHRYRSRPSTYTVSLVEKATKTQITVGGTRYMRRTGYKYGTGCSWRHGIQLTGYDLSSMVVWAAKLREAEHIKERDNRLHSLREGLKGKIERASLETLEQLSAALLTIEKQLKEQEAKNGNTV